MKSLYYNPDELKKQALNGYIRSEKMSAEAGWPNLEDCNAGFILGGHDIQIIKQSEKPEWYVRYNMNIVQFELKSKKEALNWILKEIEDLRLTIESLDKGE